MSELKDEIEAKKVNRWFEMHSSLHFVQADADQTLLCRNPYRIWRMPVMTSWCVRTMHCWSRIRSETCSSVTLKKRRRRCWRQRRCVCVCVSPTELVSSTEPCLSLENLVALWVKIWAGKVVDSNLTRVDSTLIIVFLTSGYCRRMYNMCTRFTGH